ncbi:MAG: UDP-N-acetylglucosamine 2-epimerase (non-hydrolyzing) [Atribacterota bacterium]|nr:UDP-N-acetylglucosamine 2-epimerase (non-hydrolyzing) [Atribacterota bacterium]MDD5496874.1 UDP-N-acetylglucosamine 2-epimerase (non-hydrolyzing) [Atribacterota bacterium]
MKKNKQSKIKIAFVFGTRPESIKMFPIIREVKEYPNWIEPLIILTAQHREMLDQMINLFQIKPDIDLNIMRHGQSLSKINSASLLKLEEVFKDKRPDLVLVQGDTTTTFSGALAAFYQKIKVGHIEAGLRTFKKYYPYPEEMNRRLTTVLADYHFAPTKIAANILLQEGIARENIFISGNTVIDALFLMQNHEFQFTDTKINQVIKQGKKVVLVTMHRRENWGEPLKNLCQALINIQRKYNDVVIIFPMHKNPKIREIIFNFLKDKENIILLEPLNYQEMANLMALSDLILTDSGGMQEEGPALGKPVLVLREETERPEVLEIGAAKLVGTEAINIGREVERLLDNSLDYYKMVVEKSPYGDGLAAKRIVQYLLYQYHYLDEPPSEFD